MDVLSQAQERAGGGYARGAFMDAVVVVVDVVIIQNS